MDEQIWEQIVEEAGVILKKYGLDVEKVQLTITVPPDFFDGLQPDSAQQFNPHIYKMVTRDDWDVIIRKFFVRRL